MRNKIPFTHLVPFVLLFIGLVGSAFADASSQLEQAEVLANNGQHKQIETLYKQIVTDYPGTEEAFQAQKSLLILYIETDKDY